MKTRTKYYSASLLFTILIALSGLVIALSGCNKSNDVTPSIPKVPDKLPVTPPSPEQPTSLTPVTDIITGKKTGEVFLYGNLTRKKNDDDNEWFFTDDGSNEIVLDFPSSQVPDINKNILVYGGVEDVGEVDVFKWEEVDQKPVDPVDPPNPPVTQPPTITITKVSDLTSSKTYGMVLLAGQITGHSDDDCDDGWIFSDGTDSIELDFPNCNVPAIGQPIYVYGSGRRSEVDVQEWALQ